MTLANLIDLEAQLARDRDADPDALAERDRALLPGAGRDLSRRGALLAAWLDALRAREARTLFPGAAVARALAAIRAVLALLGLLLGWGAATAVLTGGGRHPVNVWDFLLAFVGVQLALLALLAASFLLPLAAMGRPVLGLFRGALAAIYPRVAARVLDAGGERISEWSALWHRARSRRSLYHAVEPWLLLAATQVFAVAFNVGALAAILRLVVFTDVAFGWSTTLAGLDAPHFHSIAAALAAPWRALWPAAVPDPGLVAATRYSHLEAAYLLAGAGRSARPEVVGGWWPFLVASLLAYGLLPRVVLLAAARLRAARILARLPLDDAEVARLLARLTTPHLETRATSPEATPGVPAQPPAGGGTPARGQGPASVVLWRDVPGGPALESALARGLGAPLARTRATGGKDHDEPGIDWTRFAGAGEQVVLVAEAFEPPDRSVRRLLADLRRALGPRRLVLVVLVGEGDGPGPPRDADVRIWRDALATLADPFLSVEPLREVP
jgi:uncharacterized protein DUF2868